jgi:predicted nucleic acid-binding protein
LALISTEDKHHADVRRLLDSLLGDMKISPYSLIELDLLLKSEEIIVKEVKTFYDTLSELFEYRRISTLPTRPEYHREAFRLRKKYDLTYFDSLHAAVGIIENLELVSYDKEYAKVTESNYVHPDKHTR